MCTIPVVKRRMQIKTIEKASPTLMRHCTEAISRAGVVLEESIELEKFTSLGNSLPIF